MTLEVKSLDSPDESRPFVDKGKADIVKIGDATVGGTDSCQSSHTGYCLSGRMKVVMDDGEEAEIGPGDAFVISPGHDAWIVGDEACVALDFSGMADYAKAGS